VKRHGYGRELGRSGLEVVVRLLEFKTKERTQERFSSSNDSNFMCEFPGCNGA